MRIAEYIKNKRVCFVGPSPILIGKNTGNLIDNYDIVIKTNGAMFFTDDEFFNDYGKKLDILYINSSFYRSQGDAPFLSACKAEFLRFSQIDIVDHDRLSAQFDLSIYTRGIEGIKGRALLLPCIIHDLINFQAKEIHITGIDFNTARGSLKKLDKPDESLSEYHPSYLSTHQAKIMKHFRKRKVSDGHNNVSNILWVKKQYDAGLISMPDFVEEKLNLALSWLKVDKLA